MNYGENVKKILYVVAVIVKENYDCISETGMPEHVGTW